MSHETNDIPEGTLLRRRALAEALSAHGFPITEATLATKATRPGRMGGPPYRSFGRIPLYRWGDAVAWAEGCLSPPRHNTSEPDATRNAA